MAREFAALTRHPDYFYVEPWEREPIDPTVPHAVTIETREEFPNGRATCTCGSDSGWLPLWDAEQRGNWHRKQAKKLVAQGSVRVGDQVVLAVGEQGGTQMFDRQLFTSLARRPQQTTDLRKPPVFPLPVINDQPPVLLVFDSADPTVELAYERRYLPSGPLVRSSTRDSTLYWIPKLTPVFAVSDGTVVYARRHSDGYGIVVDHENGWLTVYTGLEHMFVHPSDRKPHRQTRLGGGDMLGYLGASRVGPLRPLHFELWRCNRLQDYEAVDPIRFMRRWRQLGWNDARAESTPTPQVA